MSSKSFSSSIQVPPESRFVASTLNYIISFAKNLDCPNDSLERLKGAMTKILNRLMNNDRNDRWAEPLEITLKVEGFQFHLIIDNHGSPLFLQSEAAAQLDQNAYQDFLDAREILPTITFSNRGRAGQRIHVRLELATSPESELPPSIADDEIFFRDLELGDMAELSRLFYAVYGYAYIDEVVYFPERMAQRIKNQKLVSRVACLANGRMVGHVGLVKQNDHPLVYEPALGVVDPTINSSGIFSRLFKEIMEICQKLPMSYCFYDIVTNHDYSQRLISRYGSTETALFVGAQISETQAKLQHLGLGEDPSDMDRYSILLAIKPQEPHPFGNEVVLPVNTGELAEVVLKPLGLSWVPAPRFHPLSSEGDFTVSYKEMQKSVIFDLVKPGRQAVRRILDDWRALLRSGYQYAGVDVSLAYPGIGQIYDTLSKSGFFIAGFIPYHFSDQMGVRFQSIAPTQVAFDKIKVHSPIAKLLLEVVRRDYERNRLL